MNFRSIFTKKLRREASQTLMPNRVEVSRPAQQDCFPHDFAYVCCPGDKD